MTQSELQLLERAYEAMTRNGFTLFGGYGDRHPMARMRDGKQVRVMIQVSEKANQAGGRHLYGIAYHYLDTKDFFVFFTGDEDTFLVVPTSELRKVLDEHREDVKIRKTQWHVNIFFDYVGTHQLHPVCRSRWFTIPKVSLSKFALPVAA